MLHFVQISIFSPRIIYFFNYHIGLFPFGAVGVVAGAGEALAPSVVDAFHIHDSLPSSRRTRNHFSISSKITRVVPLFTFPTIFPWASPGVFPSNSHGKRSPVLFFAGVPEEAEEGSQQGVGEARQLAVEVVVVSPVAGLFF
jgi:hypothetical protein